MSTYLRWLAAAIILICAPAAMANTYIADISFVSAQTVYTTNETIELKGTLYLSNYSSGTAVSNHTAMENATMNISVVNKGINTTLTSYLLNTTAGGAFYSRSSFYPSAVAVYAPAPGSYYIRVNYTDPAGISWWTQTGIDVINKTVNRLEVSTDKVEYGPEEAMTITLEAVSQIGDMITYTANVSINGSVRNAAKSVLGSFNCTTGSSGKCTVTTAAPVSYGDYFIEVNDYKAFGSFKVKRFDVGIAMKDELGKSIKHVFCTGEQASIDVNIMTNSTSENYTFTGTIKSSSGLVVKNISSTALSYNNSYSNRFIFTLDALSFMVGSYFVDVNVTRLGDGIVEASTSFEVRDWDLLLRKKDVDSGFEYEYSTFPNRTVSMEIYPTWRANGSIIDNINITTSIVLSLADKMSNQLASYNATWNASCGKGGCYEFSMTAPSSAGEYYVTAAVTHSGATQTAKKGINIIATTIFAQSTDKDGALKDLFGANDYAYISLSAKNATGNINLSSASIQSVTYMNGSEYAYLQVSGFSSVNNTNSNMEWAWNSTQHMLKLDTPTMGGIYTVYITGENNSIAASAKFIVNPYDVCIVAKNTAGQAGGSSGYYYVYQFKTSDTVYFEMKVTQANNPTGRAAFYNSTNSSYGMGSACADMSSTKQIVNNATVTIEEVRNMQTGKTFTLNTTASGCQADDNKGGYTCTIKPLLNWDGGSYGVKLKIVGINGQTDIAYGGFEARAFYLYAWSNNWQNKPASALTLNVYMYEAGNNWWGSYGSGGLSGTVKLEKVEYQGRDGEWLWPPIEYSSYNVSKVNTSTITNGQGTITLSANHTTEGAWKTGSYRAVLKGTDNGGTSDYGYAWFSIRQWEVYASPVECSSGTCTSTYNINAKSNISLYTTVNNAGEWGQSGRSLGGNIAISVKKIQDCRKWPCTDLNSSMYNATSINVSASSSWYWSGSIDTSYIINITPNSGSWGTGYWQVILDINGTETGSGWFNTIAFYAEAQPTDSTGISWKYNIKNAEPMYFKVMTTKSQKSGYYYASYLGADYLNTTIDDAVLRVWNQTSYQQIEYNYPENFNITIVGGGSVINGSRVINITYVNRSWPSGYYSGELTLRNADNETSTAWLWFEVKPFRVQMSSSLYSIDNTDCINGTLYIYEPDWSSNTAINGTYNITGVTENIWTSFGNSMTTYTNYTPSSFNNSANFTICPNGQKWGSGSWGNYHYLTVMVQDNSSSTENAWLSFRTMPFATSWSTVTGGTNVFKTSNIAVPVSVTKASTGAASSGNLSKIYQWRSDTRSSVREEYVFSVGSCYSNVSGSCMVNGTQTVTIYAPSTEWKDGYNYLQAEWFEYNDAGSKVDDYSGIWFNGVGAYNGWFNNFDENGNWKYYFSLNENLSIKMYVRDISNNATVVNITKVEYSTPSTSCWDDSCRTYNNASYSIIGSSGNEINDTGTVKIIKPAGNWSRGYIYFRVTVHGANGTAVIKNGNVYAKDMTGPTVSITTPANNATINTTAMWINWTTTEAATCYVTLLNYDNLLSWYCSGWNTTANVTDACAEACNATKYGFSGSSYYYDYSSRDYHSWNNGTSWNWYSGVTGMSTGGTSHYYQLISSGTVSQDYGVYVWCCDEDWNCLADYRAIGINVSSSSAEINASRMNVTLALPANGSNTTSPATFSYVLSNVTTANCSLYGNFTGSWALNTTSNGLSAGSKNFNLNLSSGGYKWNVYCINGENSSQSVWGAANWTFTIV